MKPFGPDEVPRRPSVFATRERDGAGNDLLRVSGEIDLSNVLIVEAATRELLQDRPRTLLLELSGVEFIDSSGLALLLELAARAPALLLLNPSPAVRLLIGLSGLDSILEMSP